MQPTAERTDSKKDPSEHMQQTRGFVSILVTNTKLRASNKPAAEGLEQIMVIQENFSRSHYIFSLSMHVIEERLTQ